MKPTLVVLAVLSASAAVPARAGGEGPTPPAGAPASTGPATAPPVAAPAPSAAPAEEPMVGELVTLPYNRSAAYGPTRVRGPVVNLTDTGTGEWKGNIKNLDGIFLVTESRISGVKVNLVMERDADGWTCQGTVDDNRVYIAMSKDGLKARYAGRFYDLKRVAPDLWASVPSGPGIRVKGNARENDPYYPQFIFALLATL